MAAGAEKLLRDGRFFQGDQVVVDGIDALDGKRGVVISPPTGLSARYEVMFDGHPFDVPPRNLSRYVSPTGDEECPICLDSLVDPVTLHCSHRICAQCIDEQLRAVRDGQAVAWAASCPLCRSDLTAADHDRIQQATQKSRRRRAQNRGSDVTAAEMTASASDRITQKFTERRLQGLTGQSPSEVLSDLTTADYRSRLQAQLQEQDAGEKAAGHVQTKVKIHPVVERCCDTATMLADPCGDGDQSYLDGFVSGSPGDDLLQMWAEGADYNPFKRPDDYTDFHKNCAFGNAAEVEATLQEVDQRKTKGTVDPAKRRLLEFRESFLRKSALLACINGARVTLGSSEWPTGTTDCPNPHYDPDHVKTAAVLVSHGANVNAKDVLGRSCLACAAGSHPTAKSLEIADIICASGAADPNAVDRMAVPIMYAAMHQGRVDSLQLLLKWGANPMQECMASPTWRCSLVDFARYMQAREGRHAHVVDLFDEHLKNNTAPAGGCIKCGSSGVTKLKTCKGCHVAQYCSIGCQRAHWPTHKDQCKRTPRGPLSTKKKKRGSKKEL